MPEATKKNWWKIFGDELEGRVGVMCLPFLVRILSKDRSLRKVLETSEALENRESSIGEVFLIDGHEV